jgi:AcrR family transcriptional regulator
VARSEVAGVVEGPRAAATPAQARIISAALELFSRHGVGATSLQMIADEIGVSKAAVYHQYKTKDDIVLAAAEAELARLEAVIEAAESRTSRSRARDSLVAGIVDLAVDRRRTASTILGDPAVIGFFSHHQAFRDVMHRLQRLLVRDEPEPEARVRTAMVVAAISGAAMHPFVAGVRSDVLRAELLRLARRFLDLPS